MTTLPPSPFVVAGCDGAQQPLAQLGRAGGVGRDAAAAEQRLEGGPVRRHAGGPIVKVCGRTCIFGEAAIR